jgi:hypothetical protein
MPRSHRPRRRGREASDEDRFDPARVLAGIRHVETRRDGEWNVQPIAAAAKAYVCPGCGGAVEEGAAHVVTWRADGILGPDSDLAARRHWHGHCWRIRA